MRLLICGEGEREGWLKRLCLKRGHSLPDHGPWDLAVLPLPRSEITEEWAAQLPRGQKVVCARTKPSFDALAQRRGWRLFRVLEDEAYTQENAYLTAEGALFAAAAHLNRAYQGCRCLVLGYGRIGKELTRLLRCLGAQVTVAARREESRKAAGENSVSMEEIATVLPAMEVIFNTVPAQVLGEDELLLVPAFCPVIELASPPYGLDLDAALRLNVKLFLESGLPGRYCPQSAAEALLRYIEREALKNE